MANRQSTCVSMLFMVLVLVCSTEASLDNPALCYILDGVLISYCIVVTMLFFSVKFCHPRTKTDVHVGDHTYQELLRDRNMVIEIQGQKHASKKTKGQVDASSGANNMDAYEALAPRVPQRLRR